MLIVVIRIFIILALLALVYVCQRVLRKEAKKSVYSYRLVAMVGVIFFLIMNVILQVIWLWDGIQFMTYFNNSMLSFNLLTDLLSSFSSITALAFIPAILFSVMLVISNIVLFVKEGRSVSNTLGILSSVVLVFGSLSVFMLYTFLDRIIDVHSYLGHHISLAFENTVAILLVYFECMMVATFYAARKSRYHKVAHDKKYIIVLGCSVREDGLPNGVLRKRIEAAVKFAHEQKHDTGKLPTLVFSGGKGDDEPISEAESMQKYAIAQKYEGKIILEDKSTTTHENFKFSKEKIKDLEHVAFATTDFHIFRSGVFATKLGYKHIEGIGAKSPWYFYYNALIREFIANLNAERKMHIAIVCTMIGCILGLLTITYFFDLL